MVLDLSKQYNRFAAIFSQTHDDGNKYTNRVFFDILRSHNLRGKKILDLGCGNGTDMQYYMYRFSEDVAGIDASEKLLDVAKAKSLTVSLGYFDNIPFPASEFDVVVSKYALQTTGEFSQTYKEVARILKDSGLFIFLVVHPFRQFFENKAKTRNFFDKTVVQSVLFGGKLVVEEPTHTLQDYLSPQFFKYFSLCSYLEKADFYSAEKIGDAEYPTYLIITARKR